MPYDLPTDRVTGGGDPADDMNAANTAINDLDSRVDATVPKSLVDAKGDLLVGTADNTVGRLAVGTDGQIPYADSGEATGIRWDDAPSGGGGFLGAVPYSGEYMFNAVRGGANVNGVTPVVGTLYCAPLYNTGAPYDVDRIAIQNGTGGGGGAVARLGAYTVGADGRIGDLIFDAGTVDMTGTGDKNITIDETIPTGVTLLVMVLNDTACRPRFVGSTRYASDLFWRGGNGPSPPNQTLAWISYTGYSTSSLPSTGTTAGESLNNGDCPMIAVRAA